MNKLLVGFSFLVGSTSTAFASVAPPVNVPEISALEGTAALAVVATVVLLAWERRRRAS